ncbi:MAG: hypothetical protein IT440_16205 [Phycisphaeraceae bacterium]|nr:hypothetical protein [Phycisphaeraceae bacterium]
MTTLLEKAINRVSVLPAKKQNAFARLLLAELDAETQWDASFKSSQHELAMLASAALAEHRQGKTRKMDLRHDI